MEGVGGEGLLLVIISLPCIYVSITRKTTAFLMTKIVRDIFIIKDVLVFRFVL